MSRAFASLLIATSLIHLAAPSRAEDVTCPAIDGSTPALGSIDARRRIAFVRGVMDDQAERARTWTAAWAATGLALAAGTYGMAAMAETADERLDSLVGGTTSLFIPAALVINPLSVMKHQRELDKDLATMTPTDGASDVCAALARAEMLFVLSAENEAFNTGILAQLAVIGVNGAVALFLGLGYDHWRGALLNGGGGLVISEMQLFTQPTGAVVELARYRRGEGLLEPAGERAIHLRVVPWLTRGVGGVAAVGSF